MTEPSAKTNPTIARLDRTALKWGVSSYVKRGATTREFTLPNGRIIKFRPGGKGVLRVTALEWTPDEPGSDQGTWRPEAECVVSMERVERIMKFAAITNLASPASDQ